MPPRSPLVLPSLASLFLFLAGAATVSAQFEPHCSDGFDNDEDGLVDYPDDPGCESPDDEDESNRPPATAPPPCPTSVNAEAHEDASIMVTWSSHFTAEVDRLYRAEGDGPFELFAQSTPEHPHILDASTTPGTTYRYRVTSSNELGESEGCGFVEATAVPFLPDPALGVALALACTGALAWGARRPEG
ncbi:MAG TPA: fibronectin type III domain-containing protein [Candidatus Thermoplasmatota archaeon]|nr:fibronectin type III domain-containing protein [Candidatus Thermoplasmatota archaeon]